MIDVFPLLLVNKPNRLSETGNFHKETVEDAQAFIREITKTVDKNTVIKEKEAVRRFSKLGKKASKKKLSFIPE